MFNWDYDESTEGIVWDGRLFYSVFIGLVIVPIKYHFQVSFFNLVALTHPILEQQIK